MKRDLLLVALALSVWGIGEGMFFYFQPLYLEQWGANPVQIGTILGGYGLAMTVAHIPAGYLADRFGRRPLMWICWFLGLAAAWIMAAANSLPFFVTGLLLYGLTYFVVTPLNSYVTAARGEWSVGRAITLVSAAYNFGMFFGPLLGGWIGERYGLRQIFFGSALFFTLSTLLVLRIRPQPVDAVQLGVSRLGDFLQLRFVIYLGIVFLAVFAAYLPQPLAQNFLVNERNLSLGQIGLLTSLTGLGVAILSIILGQLNARQGFLLAQAAVGGFAISLWLGAGLPFYALGYFLLGGYKTTRSFAVAQGRVLVVQANMGLAYGLIETAGSLGTVLAPILAGFLYRSLPVYVFIASAGLIFLSIAAGARYSPSPAVISPQTVMESELW